jgi:hypothetical protein
MQIVVYALPLLIPYAYKMRSENGDKELRREIIPAVETGKSKRAVAVKALIHFQ